ncbi:MAG: ATP-binding protein [Eubacteriales bacterium]|nr:ATP-binding protein [Eubacteriales bacterium]
MAYNGKLLGRVYSRLAEIRENNLSEQSKRTEEIYRKIPEIEKISNLLRAQMIELTRTVMSGSADAEEKTASLKEKNIDLQMRKAELLVQNGYPSDWLDDIYSCSLCHDTGTLQNGKICSCVKRLYNKELTAELSTLLRNGDESFESFDITLYPDDYSERFKCIPREYMRKVFSSCREFAESFPNVRSGLLLTGGPGLGKTYLSACIARVVSENGYSVFYESAVSAFRAFEDRQFSRDPDSQAAAEDKVRHMLDCDLLILDDLGTEVVTQAVQSALYTLINSRENSGKHMIISTTLSNDELQERYTPSICSRIDGFFQKIRFAGNDIRTSGKLKR